MEKLVWRLKLVAELGSGAVSETEVAVIDRESVATAETIGLTLDEGKRLAAAIQAQIVPAQVAAAGEQLRCCGHCGAKLTSKGYYPATFRSVFGAVRVRIRRLHACYCRVDLDEPMSFPAVAGIGGVSPELAYLTARFSALAPFARVAELLSELLPIGSAANAGTARNRTMRVGSTVAKLPSAAAAQLPMSETITLPVIVGLDGGYVRNRHRRPERNFEVIAGKIIGAAGEQHRFAFARNSSSPEPFKDALARAGVTDRTPATVLSDGDTGLQRLQRRVLPDVTVVLDWFHIAMRFEHALQTATGLGAGTPDAYLSCQMRQEIQHAKWRLWHGPGRAA